MVIWTGALVMGISPSGYIASEGWGRKQQQEELTDDERCVGVV